MLLAALARPERVRGLVGIAAAPDFTHDLIRAEADAEQPRRARRATACSWPLRPMASRLPITRRLLEDGERHLLLGRPIPLPARSICCTASSIPTCRGRPRCGWPPAWRARAVTVELIKDGDHRLSREEDLRRIAAALDRVLEQAGAMAEGRRDRWLSSGRRRGAAAVGGRRGGLVWLMPEPRREPETATGCRPPAPAPAVEAGPAPAPIEDALVDNPPWTGDLDGMVKRRLVRMLRRAQPHRLLSRRGEPKGLVAE